MTGGEPGAARAWSWVAALRAGSTVPWSQWAPPGHDDPRPDGGRATRFLPGAQQLELLRRLNAAAGPRGVDPGLVERVVTASAPGRGRPDLELVGAVEPRRFGPRPVDPGDLDHDELLRVATSLLAEDVVAAGAPDPPAPSLTRPWRRPYRLVGVPWLADPLRAELRRRGRPPGGVRPLVLVLGTDLATMVALAFTARAFDEGGSAWPEWLGSVTGERRVPPRADLEAMAARWGRRSRIVLDVADVPRQLGTRLRLAPPPVVPADGVDLARRVGAPLGLLVLPERRTHLLRHGLLPRLVAAGGAPLAVPEEHLPWLRRRAVRMREGLLAAGYPVVGDPDRLVPAASAEPPRGTQPDPARVLDLALRLLLEGGRR